MGAILSEPVTAMVIEHCSSSSWSAAAVTMQGWRRTHEDAHLLCPDEGSHGGVFAVLDGHGGSSAASGGARLLEEALKKVAFSGTLSGKSELEVQNILEEAFLDTDLRLRSHLEPEDRSGSTVVACILVPMDTSDSPHRFTVQLAHAGDSRAVLSRQGTLFCSKDHKPNREDETRRIEAAGGCVSQGPLGGGPMRVDGALAVSRALGDFHFKPKELDASKCKVSAVPEVQVVEGCSAGDWVLLACDGIFDVMENEEVRAFVEEHPSKSSEDIDAGQLCIDLLKRCLDKGSKDNCTACFIHFGKAPVKGRPSSELLQGGWRGASPEVQCKYAEFFRDHGFEAQASEIVVGRRSSKGPTAAPGERENGTSRSLSSFTRSQKVDARSRSRCGPGCVDHALSTGALSDAPPLRSSSHWSAKYQCQQTLTESSRWSRPKASFCCQHQGLGCEVWRKLRRGKSKCDCNQGARNWYRSWPREPTRPGGKPPPTGSPGDPEDRKAWCCQNMGRGCMLYRCEGSAFDWSMRKKAWMHGCMRQA
eukprot:g6107.t1